jgi:hypothetical protein
MLAHLRTEAYPIYKERQYPPPLDDTEDPTIEYERNNRLINEAKRRLKMVDESE